MCFERIYFENSVIGGYFDDEFQKATRLLFENFRSDALHIAVATVLKVDIMVSWNFKHIVNLGKIRLFNAVNRREGYDALEIRTPQEVIDDNEHTKR